MMIMNNINEKEPILLINSELIRDLELNIKAIEDHMSIINVENYKMIYIYCYSLFEGALNQLAKTICYAFPQKIIKKAFNNVDLDYNKVFNNVNGVYELIDEYMLKIAKSSLEELIDVYLNLASIKIPEIYEKGKLKRLSQARNTIVHNNSIKEVNIHHYTRRPEHEKISLEFVKQGIVYLLELLKKAKDIVNEKYSKYTFKKLFDESIKYTIGTNLEDYSLFYSIREDNTISLDFNKIKELVIRLSTSEKLLFSIWLQQYSDTICESININISSFPMIVGMGKETANKVLYLIKFFYRFPYVFQGQKINEF